MWRKNIAKGHKKLIVLTFRNGTTRNFYTVTRLAKYLNCHSGKLGSYLSNKINTPYSRFLKVYKSAYYGQNLH